MNNEPCPICKGAGYYCLDVPIYDPNFGHLISCQCKLEEKELRKKARLKKMSSLGDFEQKTFDTFNPSVSGIQAAFIKCKEYARNPQGWLFLFGGYGCGKTHLAAAIANEAIARDNETIFMVVPDLLDHLRSTFGPSSEVSYDEQFETIKNIFLLVLDDLGTESVTEWAREKVFQLINHRYNAGFPTVITSNKDLDRLDGRVNSRILDVTLCQHIYIKAGDYRRLTFDQRYSNYRIRS